MTQNDWEIGEVDWDSREEITNSFLSLSDSDQDDMTSATTRTIIFVTPQKSELEVP